MDRQKAASLCTQYGGYLVETKTREDIEFMATMAAITDTFTGINAWWIGLESVEDQWTWYFSNETLGDVDDWAEEEPDSDKSCVVLTRSEGSGEFRWWTEKCNTTSPSLAPVCQQCLPDENCSGHNGHFPLGCHEGYDGEECYVLVNTAMTWEKAEEYCQLHDGHLASISSEEENSFIGSALLAYDSVWLGGVWRNGTGWSWTDGSSFAWTNWADGQPPLRYDPECALLHQTTYDWASYFCDIESKFLCKYS